MPIQVILPTNCTSLSVDYIRQLDVLITDPPFSEHVHTHAVSASASRGKNLRGVEKREFEFPPLDDATRRWLMSAAGAVRRWSVIYSDVESTHLLRDLAVMPDVMTEAKRLREGRAIYIRTLPWIRWSAPQLSGTIPPSGREDVVVFHHDILSALDSPEAMDVLIAGGREYDPVGDIALFYGRNGGKAWNGPGNLTHLPHPCLRGKGKHKAQKSLFQALDLVSWFSNPGETVFDPFSGSGTVALACALLGRSCIACERLPYWHAYSLQRLVNELDERDLRDAGRFLGPRPANGGAPGDTETGPTGVTRAKARAVDREFFLAQPRIAPFADRLLKAA